MPKKKTETKKSGFTCLKEKVARKEEEIEKLETRIHNLGKANDELERDLAQTKEEHDREAFNRMVRGVREIADWRD